MKNKSNKKRINRNIIPFIIAVILFIIVFILLLNEFSLIITFALLFLALSILMQNYTYIILLFSQHFKYHLNKNNRIINSNLSSQYKMIFLNTDCLKNWAIPLNEQRIYKAKLESDGTITLRIENKHNDEVFEEQTSDYDWFLSMFRFEE